jgi:hypothetical protein
MVAATGSNDVKPLVDSIEYPRTIAPHSLFGTPLRHLPACIGDQPAFVSIDEDDDHQQGRAANQGYCDSYRSTYVLGRVAKDIGAETIQACPADPAQAIPQQKAMPWHAVRPREKCRKGSQERDKAAEEHDRSAVFAEQEPPEFQSLISQAEFRPPPDEHTIANQASDAIADLVAANRSGRSQRNDDENVEMVGTGGVKRGGDHEAFTGKWYADALEHDAKKNRGVAVLVEQVV